jgi:hypothetical protein
MAAENDYTAAEVAKFPDRLIGFCGINPSYDSALAEIDRCLSHPNMLGIKLQGSEYDWEDPGQVSAISAVLRKAGEKGAPVLLHVNAAPLDARAIMNVLETLGSNSETRITIAHTGGVIDSEIETYLATQYLVPPLIDPRNPHVKSPDFFRRTTRAFKRGHLALQSVINPTDPILVSPKGTHKFSDQFRSAAEVDVLDREAGCVRLTPVLLDNSCETVTVGLAPHAENGNPGYLARTPLRPRVELSRSFIVANPHLGKGVVDLLDGNTTRLETQCLGLTCAGQASQGRLKVNRSLSFASPVSPTP